MHALCSIFFKQKYNYLYYTGVLPPERVPKAKALGGGWDVLLGKSLKF